MFDRDQSVTLRVRAMRDFPFVRYFLCNLDYYNKQAYFRNQKKND